MKHYIYFVIFSIALTLSALSCKQVKLSDADKRFAQGDYYAAAKMYHQIYRKTPRKEKEKRAIVAFRLGESYRAFNSPERANSAYANAVWYNAPDSTVNLQYARTLQKTGKYKDAAKQYEEFLKLYPGNEFGINGLEGSQVAPQWKENPTRYRIKRMVVLNSSKGEYSPKLLPPEYDQIYFTSNRKEATGADSLVCEITGAPYYDIFMSRKNEKGDWSDPTKVDSPINTNMDEGTASFSADGSTMYYTHCPNDSTSPYLANIYVSKRSGAAWGKGVPLIISQDTLSVYAHPSLSPSGKYLYFVSDKAGGYGGKDIWRAAMDNNGEVSYIENLGKDINTAGDEMFPYVRDDNTLYFSSDGHVGMGGLDIFKATYNEYTGRWTVENMGFPINSYADDSGITFEGDKEKGYFSSNRNDARGLDHIYSFEYPSTKIVIEGYIVDNDDEFIPNAVIRVVGNDGTNTMVQGKNDGTYSFDAKLGVSYVLLASAKNFLNAKMTQATEPVDQDSTYLVDFILTSIRKPVVLENIFYDFNSAKLTSDSKEELDGLVDLLKLNPNVTIELSAHTDRKGSDTYNQKLSQQRAESVVAYLVQHGISKNRLTAVGFGKKAPKTVTKSLEKRFKFLVEGDILTEDFIIQFTPEEQEIMDGINRRTEFRVLSTTYNLE